MLVIKTRRDETPRQIRGPFASRIRGELYLSGRCGEAFSAAREHGIYADADEQRRAKGRPTKKEEEFSPCVNVLGPDVGPIVVLQRETK